MKKKVYIILFIVMAIIIAAIAIKISPASMEELLIKKYKNLYIPKGDESMINTLPDGDLKSAEFLTLNTGQDPMDGVDASVLIYSAADGVELMNSPGDNPFDVPQGQMLMFRGMLGDFYKMQSPSGDIYYTDSLEGFTLVEQASCGLTETADIPEGATAYAVAYGDRVLRYSGKLSLEDNAADVVALGAVVYVLDDSSAMFRVVLEDGRCGYINSQCLEPVGETQTIVDAGKTSYGYYEMMQDVSELLEQYPEHLQLIEIGESVMGKGIPVLLLGDADAPHKMLVQASIHAREYATTLILMKQLEVLLEGLSQGENEAMFDDVALILVPMSNPDGAMLSMTGEVLLSEDNRVRVDALGGEAKIWKANIKGIDLNRNFDANWDKIEQGVMQPSWERFKGDTPDSEPETQLLKKYTDREDVVATVSYHTCGSVIYWWYYQGGKLLNYSESLAEVARDYTGYSMVGKRGSYGSHGGLKDYGVTQGKPGITVEFGVGGSPISYEQTVKALEDSKGLLLGLAEWVEENYN